jgi:malonate transporter and related proteins
VTILLSVILPVFLILAAGYVTAWRKVISAEGIDGLMKFAQGVAVPCLLFRNIAAIDLGETFDPALLLSFYTAAVLCFVAGILGARFLFRRDWEDAVAIGFVALFSNSLLIGLPITERAYGTDALAPNFAIISIHAPFCYLVGIITMELVRSRGLGLGKLPLAVGRSMAGNALIIGVGLGLLANVTDLRLPEALDAAVEFLARAAIPTALFGLGGVLYRYRPEGDMVQIVFVVCCSLILHPALVWGLGTAAGLSTGQFRSAVITAAAAPGVNAYLFADMYGRARRVAATSVLFATIACAVTATFWLTILP